MLPRGKVQLVLTLAVVCLPLISSAASDPVAYFITAADSLAKLDDEGPFDAFVAGHKNIVGAAVGQLLDVGFDAGAAGDGAAEAENVALAERIARAHRKENGSRVPLALVEIHRRWTPGERSARAKTKALEREAFALQKEGDYTGAGARFERVIEAARRIDDRRTVAVTWGSLGVVHWYLGNMEAVKAHYDNALQARRAVEDRILEGRTLNGLGSVYWRSGDYDTAVRYYDEAAACRSETGDMGGLGISLTYKGNCYYQMGRLHEARESFDEAYAILEEHGTPQQMIEVLNSLANIYTETGRPDRANATYRRAIDIASSVDRPQDEASCRINLADNLRMQRRYREALEELERVPALLDRQPEPEKTVLYLRACGRTYREMGEFSDARHALVECLEKARVLDDPYYQIEALNDLGELYRELGAATRALEAAKEAEGLALQSGNERLLVETYALAARAEKMMGRHSQALDYRERSRERNLALGAEGAVLDDDVDIASHRVSLGQDAQARAAFYEALPRAAAAGRKDLIWTIHFGIGHSFEKENPDSALSHYERAFSVLEESRIDIGGAETRAGFLEGERRFYYEEVARYCVSLDSGKAGPWSARAFRTMERAKARGLLDLLDRSVRAEPSAEENALLDSLYAVVGAGAESERRKQRLEKRYLEVRESRLGAGAGRLDPRGRVAGIEDVREKIPKKTALLEYALGDTSSLLWVVDRRGFDVFEIPNRESLRADVEGLRDAVRRPGAGDAALREKARALYKKLAAPAAGRISKAERLVIVPDGFLFEVPFEVLLASEPDPEAGWRDLPYLTRDFDTVYAPSASAFLMVSEAGKVDKFDTDLLAFGDPDLSDVARGPAVGLSELPFSRLEVARIGERIPDKKKRTHLGGEASEARLKSTARSGESVRMLHLAAHGIVDRAEPNASCIALAPDAEEGEDGYLHTLEILSLRMSPRLVVLSACGSAEGRLSRGEGVLGLSRAFLASGTAGVVASLWEVSDESTAALMGAFYDGMAGRKRPACRALREARLFLIDGGEYAHPFHWSPFVLTGTLDTPW